jgi:hypothetical protein
MHEDLVIRAIVARPALVSLVVNRCQLSVAAYPATIGDLAARGYLVTSEPEPGICWIRLPEIPPDRSVLVSFERQVLADVSDRLAAVGWAPFDALADMCTADVHAQWEPFEESVRREARSSGLIRSRVPVFARRIVRAGAVAAAVLAYLTVHARPHSGHIWPLVAGYVVLVLPLGWLWHLARKDRLTVAGTALAASSALAADSASSGRSAMAADPAWAARQAGVGGPDGSRRPEAGWSSFTGTWRMVPIESPDVPGSRSQAARSAVAEFDGQVIARWVERYGSGEDERDVPHIAIDDGDGAWCFDAGGAYFRVVLGDLVRVRAAPRSMKLISLQVTSPAQAAGSVSGSRRPARAPLLTAAETSEVLGTAVNLQQFGIPSGDGAIYRGGGATLSVTTACGRLSVLSSWPARYFGRPLPGMGEEAWLLNRNRTVVVRVGADVAKVTLSGALNGRARNPDAVLRLAVVVAARLADRQR